MHGSQTIHPVSYNQTSTLRVEKEAIMERDNHHFHPSWNSCVGGHGQ